MKDLGKGRRGRRENCSQQTLEQDMPHLFTFAWVMGGFWLARHHGGIDSGQSGRPFC
jgi:hypothetical protein